jgi:hypothetical protein
MQVELVFDPKIDVTITLRAADEAAALRARKGLLEALQQQIDDMGGGLTLEGPNGEEVEMLLDLTDLGEPIDEVEVEDDD